MGELRDDILDSDLFEEEQRIKVNRTFDGVISRSMPSRSVSRGDAKSISEVYKLIQDAIKDDEKRRHIANGLFFKETSLVEVQQGVYQEDPSFDLRTPSVTFSLRRRIPGAYGEGAPMQSGVRNRRPILREETVDPDNPGYRIAVLGYLHDNIIRLTCWSRTNHEANALAERIEVIMEQYSWYFASQGVPRVLFWERDADMVITKHGDNFYYGRPIEYFVRTETLQTLREKSIEELCFEVAVREQ